MRLELDQVLHRTIETIAFIGSWRSLRFVSPCSAICKRTRLAKQCRASAPIRYHRITADLLRLARAVA